MLRPLGFFPDIALLRMQRGVGTELQSCLLGWRCVVILDKVLHQELYCVTKKPKTLRPLHVNHCVSHWNTPLIPKTEKYPFFKQCLKGSLYCMKSFWDISCIRNRAVILLYSVPEQDVSYEDVIYTSGRNPVTTKAKFHFVRPIFSGFVTLGFHKH